MDTGFFEKNGKQESAGESSRSPSGHEFWSLCPSPRDGQILEPGDPKIQFFRQYLSGPVDFCSKIGCSKINGVNMQTNNKSIGEGLKTSFSQQCRCLKIVPHFETTKLTRGVRKLHFPPLLQPFKSSSRVSPSAKHNDGSLTEVCVCSRQR